MDEPESKTGYTVFVRTVSGLIAAVCVVAAMGIYLFRVGIAETYFPGAVKAQDLNLIVCLSAISLFFTTAIVRGRFLWFLRDLK